MNITQTSFFDPTYGEVLIKSEVKDDCYSNVTAIELLSNKETKRYFNGVLKFTENKQAVHIQNYQGFIKKSIAKNVFKFMQEDDGLNIQFN
jgi:hypothetical protein